MSYRNEKEGTMPDLVSFVPSFFRSRFWIGSPYE